MSTRQSCVLISVETLPHSAQWLVKFEIYVDTRRKERYGFSSVSVLLLKN